MLEEAVRVGVRVERSSSSAVLELLRCISTYHCKAFVSLSGFQYSWFPCQLGFNVDM
jgi:hypothetical protein